MAIDAQGQSEHDFPCMSVRNGITDGTKMAVGTGWELFHPPVSYAYPTRPGSD